MNIPEMKLRKQFCLQLYLNNEIFRHILIKEVQDFYTKNYKTLLKENLKDLNK